MFKPKQPQKEEPPKNLKLPHEPQLPNMKLIRSMFDECERRRGTTIELPLTHAGKNYLLMVLWEKGIEFPAWTLYDEAGGDNAMLFSQGFPPSDLDFVLEMLIMSTSQGAPAPVSSGFIPEELRPSAESLAAQAELEEKKPDDIWKQSVARSTHGGLPAQNSVYPDPVPRPPAPPPPPVPQQPMPQMAPPMPPHMPQQMQQQMPQQMPPQPGYPPQPPGYPQPMQPGMVPGGQYPGMPPQPGYPPQQPGYPPPQPGYPQQMPPPGYPQMQPPGYPQPQYPGAQQPGAWPQPGAPPPPPTPAPMPIDMGLISKRTDVTLNSLLLESGLLNSQSLDAALRMQDLVEEKQLTSREAARVLARYHTKGKTIEQFVAVAMQELGDGGAGAASGGAAAGAPAGQGQQTMVSVKDALDLLVRSGVLTDNDIQTANEVRKKHGGDISKILGAANKLDEKTFEAAIICVPLIRDGAMKIEQVSIALQYCSRMRTSFDDACAEMNWPQSTQALDGIFAGSVGGITGIISELPDLEGTDGVEDVPNPYIHSNKAKELELKENLQEAETEYRMAVQAADSLPHAEYTRDFITALDRKRNGVSPTNKHLPEEALTELISAYRELLALPFLTRTQLAGFYARHNALPEAKEIIEQALAIEADTRGHAGHHPETERRASELLRNITDILGPVNAEELFLAHFDKLDVNKNGFIDEAELKRAQLDLTVTPEAQSMIRYLLYHYFKVEKASNDEFGEEISGISKADVRNFQKSAKSNWKRLKE